MLLELTRFLIFQAQINLVSVPSCERSYSSVARVTIGNEQLCAGRGVTDTCTGDSGGGMMLADSNGRYSVIGITSFGVKCAEADFPGVYTRVDEFLQWIRQNLN
jgi:secreted trypsin-like serine protease